MAKIWVFKKQPKYILNPYPFGLWGLVMKFF